MLDKGRRRFLIGIRPFTAVDRRSGFVNTVGAILDQQHRTDLNPEASDEHRLIDTTYHRPDLFVDLAGLHSGQSVDLLPWLKVRFDGMLRADLLGVQLRRNDPASAWQLLVRTRRQLEPAPIDLRAWAAPDDPLELLDQIGRYCESAEHAALPGIFSPAYLALLDRLDLSQDAEENAREAQRLEGMFDEAIELLDQQYARHAPAVIKQLVELTATRLRSTACLDDAPEGITSAWQFLGVLCYYGSEHALYQVFMDELHHDIWRAIQALARDDKLALLGHLHLKLSGTRTAFREAHDDQQSFEAWITHPDAIHACAEQLMKLVLAQAPEWNPYS